MPASPEDFDRDPVAAASGQSTQLGMGERLRSARKGRALSLDHVAEALHLDEAVVLALEEERFEELGAAVFVRGHLKAYAKLVGLPLESVLDGYPAPEPQSLAVPSVERNVRRSVTINPAVWGVSALVMLLGLVLTIYVVQDDAVEVLSAVAPEEPAARTALETPEPATDATRRIAIPPPLTRAASPADAAVVDEPGVEIVTATAPADGDAAVLPTSPEPEADLSEAELRPAAEESAAPTAAAELVPRPDLMRLSLHFREESWVEISDANERLLFGLQREGRRREVAGEPPFQLLIGNAAGVDMTVNDEPYAVPRSGVTGKVARFEIGADAPD